MERRVFLQWVAGGGSILVLSGCRSGGSSQEEDSPTTVYTPSKPPRAKAPPPTPESDLEDLPTIYGPMTDAELAKYYPPRGATPTPRPPAPTVQATPRQRGPVAPDSSWQVPLSRDWRYVVVHHSAVERGNAAIYDRAHKGRGWLGLGYHFVIGNGTDSGDGQIETGFRWRDQLQGAHAGHKEFNDHGVGICLVGNFEESSPTTAQMDSLSRLTAWLRGTLRIQASPGYVLGHREIPGATTQCPGRNFDMNAFRKIAANGESYAAQPARTSSGNSSSRVLNGGMGL